MDRSENSSVVRKVHFLSVLRSILQTPSDPVVSSFVLRKDTGGQKYFPAPLLVLLLRIITATIHPWTPSLVTSQSLRDPSTSLSKAAKLAQTWESALGTDGILGPGSKTSQLQITSTFAAQLGSWPWPHITLEKERVFREKQQAFHLCSSDCRQIDASPQLVVNEGWKSPWPQENPLIY